MSTNSNAIVRLTFPAINVSGASAGRSYARFRLSTDRAAGNAFGLASNGEVEDYPVTIMMPSIGTVNATKTVKVASSTNGGPPLANNDVFGFAIASLGDIDGDGAYRIKLLPPSETIPAVGCRAEPFLSSS